MPTTFADWLKARLDDLRLMIGPAEPADGHETRTEERLVYVFKSNPANLARVRKAVEGFCDGTQLDRRAKEEIGLVVNEAVANVMRHAYANATDRPIEVSADRHDGGVRVRVRDWGPGTNPGEIKKPDKEPDPDDLTPGGLGLMCMRRLMDDVRFVPQPDGMLLEMTRTTPGSLVAAKSAN